MVGDTTRKTVPLTCAEMDLIQLARTEGTPYHAALTLLAGPEAARSDAATLHALVAFGLTTLGEQVALHDYGQLAASHDAEDTAYAAALRRRKRGRP